MSGKKVFSVFISVSRAVSLIISLIFACFAISCRNSIDSIERIDAVASIGSNEAVAVETIVIEEGMFYKEIHSNGRLRAKRKQKLAIAAGGEVIDVKVKNGDYVNEGQALAMLCSDKLVSNLERANLRFMRASLDMEDILLGMGYSMHDSLIIPDFTWKMAGVRSGYFEVLNDIRSIEQEMQKTIIRAPFDGVVADLQIHVNELTMPGEALCSLIDNTRFLVSFPLMEKELEMFGVAMQAVVSPFSRPEMRYAGYLYSINPVVDEYGQVEVTVLIEGAPGLLEGTMVKVILQRNIPEQMVVPRSAVLLRDGEEVLFKYSLGEAVWTYVNVMFENSTHYSVIADPGRLASLAPSDTVIKSGNVHLSHGSQVKRKNK